MTDQLTLRQALAQSGLAPVDANALLAHVLGKDRAWLAAHATDPLPQKEMADFLAAATRRRQGEPVAYLTGRREFHSIEVRVTPDVLIPRPETETLVDALLERMAGVAAARVLDLGTGSGAIALAIAHDRSDAHLLAVDIDSAALAVARDNAQALGLRNLRFVLSNWYQALDASRFDAIVANPPYIADGDSHLSEGDLRYEPRAALTPGGDGMGALRTIIEGASAHLAPHGVLAVEHGYDQSFAVREMFTRQGFGDIRGLRDLAGHWRVVIGEAAQ